MICRIQHTRGVYLSIQAEVTWATAATRQHGSCTLTIPRGSPAWDAEVIDERGGFLCEILTPFGIWQGVADIPQWSPVGLTVEVRSLSVWLEDLRVGTGRFVSVTAGIVVQAVYRQALAGRGATALTLGHVLYAPPLVPEITLDRQTALDVFTELQELTGQEWVITLDGRLHWLPHGGQYHDLPPVVDDGRVFPSLSPGTLDDTASQVIEIDESGRAFVAHSYDSRPLRPRQTVERV